MYGLGRNTSRLYQIDPATGASTLIADIAPIRSGLTFSPDCVMYGVTVFDGALYEIDPGTGVRSLVGATGMGNGLVGLINADPIVPACGSCDPCDINCDGMGLVPLIVEV